MASTSNRPFASKDDDFEWDYDSKDVKESVPRDSYDRRELRRRLSLDSDQEDGSTSQFSARVRRSNLRERLMNHGRNNLQICFVNDEGIDQDDEDDDESSCKDSSEPYSVESVQDPCLETDQKDNHHHSQQDIPTKNLFSKINFKPFSISVFGTKESSQSLSSSQSKSFQSFEECHEHILSEAKKALKSAKEMARMQMQLEREQSKASKVLGIIPVEGVVKRNKLKKESLKSIKNKQLSSVLKDLTEQTDKLNVCLLKMLEERDELQMEQDSLLLDIEDLTRFLQSQDL